MHNIEHYTYDAKIDKKRVQAELDNYVAHEDWQEGASGLPAPIKWVENPIYESYDDAHKAIERADKGAWYNQMAVRYKAYPRAKTSKELDALRERVSKQSETVAKITAEASVKKRASEYIGCSGCGSSLKRGLLAGERCPLCRTDLRSKTNLDRIQNAQAKLDTLRQQLHDTEQKLSRKQEPTIRWLVKIEYHT